MWTFWAIIADSKALIKCLKWYFKTCAITSCLFWKHHYCKQSAVISLLPPNRHRIYCWGMGTIQHREGEEWGWGCVIMLSEWNEHMVCGVQIHNILSARPFVFFTFFSNSWNFFLCCFYRTSQHLISLICVGEGKYCQEKLFLSFFMKADLRFFLCVHGLLK